MPRLPTNPLALAWLLFRAWRRLPAGQRSRLARIARRHGPRVASAAVGAASRRYGRRLRRRM